MKNKIIVLVGNSGSGKSHMANHLSDEYGIPKVISRTTRPQRDENDTGYKFVTNRQFDGYMEEWKLCSTEFGGDRYTSLYSDVTDPVMCMIVDEDGLRELRKSHDGIFDVFAVRLYMDVELRKELISEERMMRDEGKFTMSEEDFDYWIDTSNFELNEHKVCKMLVRLYQKFND